MLSTLPYRLPSIIHWQLIFIERVIIRILRQFELRVLPGRRGEVLDDSKVTGKLENAYKTVGGLAVLGFD